MFEIPNAPHLIELFVVAIERQFAVDKHRMTNDQGWLCVANRGVTAGLDPFALLRIKNETTDCFFDNYLFSV